MEENKNETEITLNLKPFFIYVFTIIFSIFFIVIGNRIIKLNSNFNIDASNMGMLKAKILSVETPIKKNLYDETTEDNAISKKIINFKAKIKSGKLKGKIIEANQTFDNLLFSGIKEVEKGDNIIVFDLNQDPNSAPQYVFGEYLRSNHLTALLIIFLSLLLLLGGFKGVNTIISLVFTICAIFFVLIPSIFAGYNIYLSAIVVSAFIIISTLLIIYGANSKSLSAGIGCFLGVLLAGFITYIMNFIMNLSGVINDESIYLMYIKDIKPIDLRGIIFASIIVGAVGAIMDVSISISTALHEIKQNSKQITFSSLFKSGLSIGKDIMGTMSNTLILAYIGSSLSLVLILMAYNSSTFLLFNKEFIVVEILQALVGSIGIIFSIPFTTIISGVLLAGIKK